MSISTIEKLLTKDCQSANSISCPVCQKEVKLRLFENTDLGIAALLLSKEKNSYIAVCPNCASVFDINANFMKEFLNGTFCLMTQSDLKLIVKGKENE